jgi:hypothetical protein
VDLVLGAPESELGRAATGTGALPAAFGHAAGLVAETNNGKNRPSQAFDHLGDGEVIRVDGELVTAHATAPTMDDPVLPEIQQNDREKLGGNAFTFGELGDGKATGRRPRDAREGPDAVGRLAIEHLYYTNPIGIDS